MAAAASSCRSISARKSLKYRDLSGHWKSDLDVSKEEYMPKESDTHSSASN
jgi:hypothetical protein